MEDDLNYPPPGCDIYNLRGEDAMLNEIQRLQHRDCHLEAEVRQLRQALRNLSEAVIAGHENLKLDASDALDYLST